MPGKRPPMPFEMGPTPPAPKGKKKKVVKGKKSKKKVSAPPFNPY